MQKVDSVVRAVSPYTLTHVSDATLLKDLATIVAQERSTTATLLAHIGEVDARRLYAPAGYSSMFEYCVRELHLSEDAAAKRIHAARAAREYPSLFVALADGRIHLSAICLIAPHISPGNVDSLIAASTHRRKSEVEDFVIRRFPRSGVVTAVHATSIIRPVGPHAPGHTVDGRDLDLLAPLANTNTEESGATVTDERQHAPGHVESQASAPGPRDEHAPGRAEGGTHALDTSNEHAPGHVVSSNADKLIEPAAQDLGANDHFRVHLTITRATHDKLRQAQNLLSHAVPRGDLAKILDRALDALIVLLEKRRFGDPRSNTPMQRATEAGAGEIPTAAHRSRYIPPHIRRAVWERDRGQCTFVSETGTRCAARGFLEFDHVNPVARGGKPTVEGLRLRCRTHNQYEAERAFGADFMRRKREGRDARRRKR